MEARLRPIRVTLKQKSFFTQLMQIKLLGAKQKRNPDFQKFIFSFEKKLFCEDSIQNCTHTKFFFP